jgi:hypothetical protein
LHGIVAHYYRGKIEITRVNDSIFGLQARPFQHNTRQSRELSRLSSVGPKESRKINASVFCGPGGDHLRIIRDRHRLGFAQAVDRALSAKIAVWAHGVANKILLNSDLTWPIHGAIAGAFYCEIPCGPNITFNFSVFEHS